MISGILSGIYIYFDIPSGILSSILLGILSYNIYIYIHSDIFWHSIWHLALAVEVRQCPLHLELAVQELEDDEKEKEEDRMHL